MLRYFKPKIASGLVRHAKCLTTQKIKFVGAKRRNLRSLHSLKNPENKISSFKKFKHLKIPKPIKNSMLDFYKKSGFQKENKESD